MTCTKQTTRATIIAPDGRKFVGTNACASPQPVCPRGGLPTGVGYELCGAICRQTGHAEVNACRAAGAAAYGATLYLEGHTYVCGACQRIMDAHGIAATVFGAPLDDAA